MALTNEEKVEALQEAAARFFRTLDTLPDWVNFINNVTKIQVKSFLKNAIDAASDSYDDSSVFLSGKSDDYETFSSEIDAL